MMSFKTQKSINALGRKIDRNFNKFDALLNG